MVKGKEVVLAGSSMGSRRLSLRLAKKSSKTSDISDLVTLIKDLSSQGEIETLRDLLVERDNNMKLEAQQLVELEKLKFEEKLESFKIGGQVVKDKVLSLISRDKKIDEESLDKVKEKNKVICGLRKEIRELSEKSKASDDLMEVYVDKFACLNEKLPVIESEIEALKRDKLSQAKDMEELLRENAKLRRQSLEASENELSNQIVAESNKGRTNEAIEAMRFKELEFEKTVEKLKSQNLEVKSGDDKRIEEMSHKQSVVDGVIGDLRRKALEDSKTIEKLSRGKVEAEKCIEMYKKKLDRIRDEASRKQSALDEAILDLRRKNSVCFWNLEELENQDGSDLYLSPIAKKGPSAAQTSSLMQYDNDPTLPENTEPIGISPGSSKRKRNPVEIKGYSTPNGRKLIPFRRCERAVKMEMIEEDPERG